MPVFKKPLALLITMLLSMLLAACATGPSGETFGSPIGEWREKFEMSLGSYQNAKLTILDESSGVYTGTHYPGKVEFHSIGEPREWKGYWINEDGRSACLETRSGSKFWGVTVFKFNESYNRYTGYWDFCGEGQQYSLEGYR